MHPVQQFVAQNCRILVNLLELKQLLLSLFLLQDLLGSFFDLLLQRCDLLFELADLCLAFAVLENILVHHGNLLGLFVDKSLQTRFLENLPGVLIIVRYPYLTLCMGNFGNDRLENCLSQIYFIFVLI